MLLLQQTWSIAYGREITMMPFIFSIAMLLIASSIPRIYAASWSSSSPCFVSHIRRSSSSSLVIKHHIQQQQRLFSKQSSDEETASSSTDQQQVVAINVSRLSTLQTLLSKRGAPGSIGCNQSGGDLIPISISSSSPSSSNEYKDLHPHLLPLAKSTSSGNIICALRRAYADDSPDYESPSINAPWPIVESGVGLPGMRLLSLNSEHLMRRIAADADANLESNEAQQIVGLYNDGLGEGKLTEKSMDMPYEIGSVDKLGYGLDKFVLLRVGPFPDLYETMSNQHLSKGDEESSLIAAETSNGKFGGFGSTFAFYAKLLASLPNRKEECRDAARMTLRLPLPSSGLTRKEFVDIAKMAGLESDESDDNPLAKMLDMYEKIREHERDENSGDKTPKQTAMEDANYLLDVACLTGQKYGEVREKIADIYRKAGMEDDAIFTERWC